MTPATVDFPLYDSSHSTPDDAEIPVVSDIAPSGPLSPELYAFADPSSHRTEALRELRAQLLLRWFDECRTLACISATKGNKADQVAANLAILMAQLGEQTLLIDANLRSPRLNLLFGLSARPGLPEVLKDCDLCDDAIQQVGQIPNLHVLCSSPATEGAQELISRTPFIYLTKTLADRFKAIIITTPPALDCADAQIIAARAGGCLLVARRHRTRLNSIHRLKAKLAPARTTIIGGVIVE